MLADVRRAFVQQTNRYSAALRKLLSINGEVHDVSFGVHLEDERAEHSFIKGENIFAQYNEATSDGTHLSVVGIENPNGSSMLVVITGVHATLSSTAGLRFGIGGSGGIGSPAWGRDTRLRQGGSSLVTARGFALGTAVGTGIVSILDEVQIINAEEPFFFVAAGGVIPAVVLHPGYQCKVAATSLGANTLKACFSGYERPLESGELV